MGCSSCGTSKDGAVSGCGSGGSCSTGGCNRMNVMDWFSDMPISFNENFNIIEVSFKKGSRKGFYRNPDNLDFIKGQLVVVEAAQGYDVGEVSLQGELVKLQMKKRKVTERDDTIRNVLRVANETDINALLDARNKEKETMVRARAMARQNNLEMKIGDIEYQGDNKKVTIFYTADGRVDFRELVKVYAREFKVKIEMRQIGARQEAARVGGIGTCGRELCCSTWLNDFKSVTTQAVRYQNLAINTDKLSGQCGRLKCCLNYELDTYNDSLKKFPKHADKIETEEGIAWLKKTEILKKQMWYEYDTQRGNFFKLDIEDVKELIVMNKAGQKPKSLEDFAIEDDVKVDESKHEDLVGQVTLNTLEEKERKRRRGGNNNNRNKNKSRSGGDSAARTQTTQTEGTTQKPPQQQRTPNPNQKQGQNKGPNPNQKQGGQNQKQNPNQKQGQNQKRPNPNQQRNNPNREKKTDTNQNPPTDNKA
ncbi:MAG TPA: regulatory iron-sulfur-containing complex subunit RicT [Chitinophagales bacterium]|nr:regulatory iron-sulfur-containing complex subunit RicT [Chitinophagales bacterium]